MYVVTTTTLERELGIETLKNAINAIEESISGSKGQFSVKMEVSHEKILLRGLRKSFWRKNAAILMKQVNDLMNKG